MNFQKSFRLKRGEEAVSPVVGVMLMLVVTIIIAAMVSAFAGGLAKTSDKGPTANLQVSIVNDGTWGGSTFDVVVLGVSDPIPSSDLKLYDFMGVREWNPRWGNHYRAQLNGQ